MFIEFKKRINRLFDIGLFHIVGANTLGSLISFISNIVIVRFMSQDDYGVFSYANNLFMIVSLFTGLGLLSGMLQFCAEKRSITEKEEIYWYVLVRGIVISFILAIAMLLIGLFVSLPIHDAGIYFSLFAPILILDFLFQYVSILLRSKKENKKFANLQLVKSVLYFLFACGGALVGGVTGTVVGRYFAYGICIIVGARCLVSVGLFPQIASPLPCLIRKELWGFSLPTLVSSSLNQLTFMLDVFLVGALLTSTTEVALYQVATIIPEGLAFVPASVVVAIIPYFVENNHDRSWLEKQSKNVILVSFAAYSALATIMFFLSPWVIELLWGDEYIGAVIPFRCLSICFVLNAIRLTCTNLLCALRAVNANFLISIVSLFFNVFLCFVLIPQLGIMGAAMAPTLVSFVAAILSIFLYFRTMRMLS